MHILHRFFFAYALLTLCIFFPTASSAAPNANIPLPAGFQFATPINTIPPKEILDQLVGIPYRADGVINDLGQYIVYAQPDIILTTPGLNCSGLTLQASRFLLQKNISLEQAVTDRLGDSSKDSPYGHDWDFGWDWIMNISEGFPRSMLLPNFQTIAPEKTSGFSPRGFDIQDSKTWKELLQRFKTRHLYLLSFNKTTTQKGYSLLHYHVGIIYKVNDQEVWMYQTTTKGKKANRRNLATADGLRAFLQAFANTGKVKKHLIVLEVAMP